MSAIAVGGFGDFGGFGGSQRILVCDDERHIVRLLQVLLERAGHSVVCAFDGRQALEALGRADGVDEPAFDAVILDLMMPYLDGFEVLKWIRIQYHSPDVWVAIVTAQPADMEQAASQLAYRPDKYVKKPFNPKDALRWLGPAS